MRTDERNARIVKLTLEIRQKQHEKRRLVMEAAEQRRPQPREKSH